MRVFVFNSLFYSVTLTMAAIAIVASFGPGGQTRMRWFLRRHGLLVQGMVRWLLAGRIEIRGLEHVRDGKPAILAPKHQSELDVFIPVALYPDLAAIAMQELENYPLIGPVLRKLDYILVSVEGKRKNQLGQVLEGAERVNAQGRTILIYPEGELMRLGARERYKTGVFHVYERLGLPVVPVAQSLGLIWPQREWRKRVGQTGVWEFLEPIAPGLDKDTFMAELERRIELRTMELIREHGAPEIVAVAEERHRLGLNNSDTPPLRRTTLSEPSGAALGASGARPTAEEPRHAGE